VPDSQFLSGHDLRKLMTEMKLVRVPELTLYWLCSLCFGFNLFAAVPAGNSASAHKDLEFTRFFQRSSGWTAGDGALSVPLSDGRVLWLFGDSHLDDLDVRTGTTPCLFQTRNAALLHHTNDVQHVQTLAGKGPGFRSWFKNSTNESEWFWPVCGFQEGNAVYVYLAALRKTAAEGPFGFESIGRDYWAKIKFPEMEPIRYIRLPPLNGVTFGQGFVREGTYRYAFGQKQHGLGCDVYVARFPAATPEAEWRFWDGTNWNVRVESALSIAQGRSTSVHVCKVKDKFLLTTSAFCVGCDQGKEIFIATSPHPTGPFGPFKSVFTIDDYYQGHLPFFYLPVAHPEFINAQQELLVTYSINNYEPCVASCNNGRSIPDHYRPKAIRVPLKLIDPGL
jgi:uncharacterized protein DUF5005